MLKQSNVDWPNDFFIKQTQINETGEGNKYDVLTDDKHCFMMAVAIKQEWLNLYKKKKLSEWI